MIETLLTAIIYMLWFILGFMVGNEVLTPKRIKELVQQTSYPKIFNRNKLGAIPRPTAQELYKRDNPIISETEEAMKETLDKVFIKE